MVSVEDFTALVNLYQKNGGRQLSVDEVKLLINDMKNQTDEYVQDLFRMMIILEIQLQPWMILRTLFFKERFPHINQDRQVFGSLRVEIPDPVVGAIAPQSSPVPNNGWPFPLPRTQEDVNRRPLYLRTSGC